MAAAVWTNENYVKGYLLASSGMKKNKLAKALGVSHATFDRWFNGKKYFRKAVQDGWKNFSGGGVKNGVETLFQFVYKRLSPELRELWDKIKACNKEKNGVKRMEAMLQGAGKYARMQLFLHAFVCYNFSVVEACRAVNIDRSTYKFWMKHEPRFAELMDEMNEAKGDFFESGLVKLVRGGDVNAILFANRTFNRDRGYADKTTMEVKGGIDVRHSMINLEELDLPPEVLKIVLDAIRKGREKKLVAKNGELKALEGKVVKEYTRPIEPEIETEETEEEELEEDYD